MSNKDKSCKACAYCYMEPSDMNFVCGHPDAGIVGKYTRVAASKDGHCTENKIKFEQHPLRTEQGDLKSSVAHMSK